MLEARAVPPPPGLNYTATIKSLLGGLLISHAFTAILIPLFFALLYFSTSRSRRQPIFAMNVVNILLAFIMGVVIDTRAIHYMLSPLHPLPLSIDIAIGILGCVQSLVVDMILLLRLLAVYPRSYLGRTRFIAILIVPVALKVGRVINLAIFIKVLSDATRDPKTAHAMFSKVWAEAPYLKIEWFAYLVDNSYASIFFLVRLGSRQRVAGNTLDSPGDSSLTRRLRVLFYIAATNFVFPVMFCIAEIITVFCKVDVIIINNVVLVNTAVNVIGVLFATVWAGSQASDRGACSEPSGYTYDGKALTSTSGGHLSNTVSRGGTGANNGVVIDITRHCATQKG